MKLLDNGKFALEVEDSVEIDYTVGNKFLGKHTVSVVYDNAFSAVPEHGNSPLFFPNPEAVNIISEWVVSTSSEGCLAMCLIAEVEMPMSTVYVYRVNITREQLDAWMNHEFNQSTGVTP